MTTLAATVLALSACKAQGPKVGSHQESRTAKRLASKKPSASTKNAARPAKKAWDKDLVRDLGTWRKEWLAPGASVVVVDKAKTLLEAGVGLKDLSKSESVGPDTSFPIASNSKTFTAAAVALLAERGKLRLDDPVTKHLPEFTLGDPEWAKRVTIRDLLAHRSGLPAHAVDRFYMPMLMSGQKCTSDKLAAFMKTVKPGHPIRSKAAYSNLAYMVMADLIAKVSGATWAEFVTAEFIKPLGLTGTVVGRDAFVALKNRVAPHDIDPEGKHVAIELMDFGVCGRGTSAMFSSARDLGVWMRLFLNGGKHDGKAVLSEETVAELLRPHTLKHPGKVLSKLAQSDFAAHTLGWESVQHKGLTVVRMGGSGPGYQSGLFLLPRQGKAFAVLQNIGGNGFYVFTAFTLLDRIANLEPTDWAAIFRKFFPLPPAHEARPLDAAKLDDYVGSYATAKGYPRLVERDGDKLYMRGKSAIGTGPPMHGKARLFGLAKAEGDVMFIRTSDAVFTFRRDDKGAVTGFTEKTAAATHEFTRAQAPAGGKSGDKDAKKSQ